MEKETFLYGQTMGHFKYKQRNTYTFTFLCVIKSALKMTPYHLHTHIPIHMVVYGWVVVSGHESL